MIRPLVHQAMNQYRITMIGELLNYSSVNMESKFAIAQSMRVLRPGLQRHQVHDIDNPDS